MSDSYQIFRNRVAHIYAEHDAAPRLKNVSRTIDHDGYVVIRGRAPRRSFPWTGLFLVIAVFFIVKGSLVATLGDDFYKTQVSKLQPASAIERVGVWTMKTDPISGWVAQQINSLR